MKQCKICQSHAINIDPARELCDVCLYREHIKAFPLTEHDLFWIPGKKQTLALREWLKNQPRMR